MPRPIAWVTISVAEVRFAFGSLLLYGRGMPRPIAWVIISVAEVRLVIGSQHVVIVLRSQAVVFISL